MHTARQPQWTLVLGVLTVLLVGAPWGVVLAAEEVPEHPLLGLMRSELELSMHGLVGPDGTKPYFIQYAVTDDRTVEVAATLGAVTGRDVDHARQLDVDVRCGDYALDNTRQIRGGFGDYDGSGGTANLPLDGEPLASRHALWLATDGAFKSAVKRLANVKANLKVKVEEEDPSDDFSREEPSVHIGPWVTQAADPEQLAARVRAYSLRFKAHPEVFGSRVSISGSVVNRLATNSEGSRLQFGRGYWRISVYASTVAEDGMQLWQGKSLDADSAERLPGDAEVNKLVDEVIADVLALRQAPIVEPFTGPAILMNRASGVFFHEIFGHRIEGHRQKDVEEGQTFAKKIDQPVLPDFISVLDDPSMRRFGGVDLNGFYEFDEECVPARPVSLVQDGVLKTFLMSRSPTRGFTKSNGHGRREPGSAVVARQGNLVIQSARRMPFADLRKALIEECRRQGKEFGLMFADISGGFTMTERWSPQAFKVEPILVYRVYADGRPDDLVRGVDIVGTPLTSLWKILQAADDPDVFNGFCGAESGSVPVSAISPSLLVEQIEVEKKEKDQDRPPILSAPIAPTQGSGPRPDQGKTSN